MEISNIINADDEPVHKRKVLANGWTYYEWSRALYPYPCDSVLYRPNLNITRTSMY